MVVAPATHNACMSDNKVAVSRPMVGVLALACLVIAALIWTMAPDSQETQLWLAGFIRVGLVMSALWIALPTRDREAAWANVSRSTLIGMVLAMLALLRLPFRIVLPLFITVAVIGYTLRPRAKKRPQTRRRASGQASPSRQEAETLSATESES